MTGTYLSLSGDTCSSATLCNDTPNTNSDLDLDSPTDKNAAWAGIAVVIVVAAVGAGVWFGIRRRRRSRGGHNSVDTGANVTTTFAFWKGWGRLWRRPGAARPTPESQVEQGVTDEPKDQRRSSSASNLKRTPTASSQVDAPSAAKLGTQLKDAEAGHYPMVPLHHPQLQSTETFTTIPPEAHYPSRNPRDSLASTHRSSASMSIINMPPPGLGPPIHHSDSPSSSALPPPPSHSASTSQPSPQN